MDAQPNRWRSNLRNALLNQEIRMLLEAKNPSIAQMLNQIRDSNFLSIEDFNQELLKAWEPQGVSFIPILSSDGSSIEHISSMALLWAKLPYDIFSKLVMDNNVKGKDLISLCLVSSDINDKCNNRDQQLFRNLLARDYGVNQSQNPRDDYVELSKPKAWVCGRNGNNQLGLRDYDDKLIPVRIETISNVVAAAGGDTHSLFLTGNGNIWGAGDNNSGQLGIGDDIERSIPTSPVRIETLSNIVAIAAGHSHSLFLGGDGRVWSCGAAYYGRLGLGDTVNRYTPTRIETLFNIVAISAGSYHSLFLDRDGRAWTAGNNINGRLGLGNTLNRSTPTRIETLFDIVAISGGDTHSLFLDRDGFVWGCGSNEYAQLGLTDDISAKSILTPKRIETLYGIVAIATAETHSLFLDRNGYVWGCGSNSDGQLGLGHQASVLVPVRIETLSNVVAISTNGKHSLFLDRAGSVWVCGLNNRGQLGLNSRDDRMTPVRIETLSSVVGIAAGLYHSLFLAPQ